MASQPEPILRGYRPGDWRAMHALDLLCFAPPFRFTRSAMRRFAETPRAITLLAESADHLAAFCIAHIEPAQHAPEELLPETRRDLSPGNNASKSKWALAPGTTLSSHHAHPRPESSPTCTAYIVTLDVAPPYRRHGLARLLMHQAETRAQAAGAGTMALHVFSANSAAIQFYEALGYHPIGTAPGFYAPGLDALVYRKPLNPAPRAVLPPSDP